MADPWGSLEAEFDLRYPTPGRQGGTPDILRLDEDGRSMPLQQLAVDEHRAAAPLPAFAPGPQPRQRPASASTVERMAGMLRSISFAAGQPPTGTSGADSARSQACAAVAASVRRDFAGAAIGRLVESAPHVALALQGAVLASAGVLLGAEAATMAFEWARSSLDDLRHFVAAGEAATAQLFPGAYYREIVEADVAQLAAALTDTGRQHERRSAARLDVLAALARPGAGAAELEGLAQAAGEHGLVAEAAAARHVAELSRAHSACREAERTALDAAAAAKRGLADAQSAMKHERVERGEAQRTARALEDERNALRVQLARDTEERRRVEGASIKTLEQLKLNDEARWAAERALQAEQRKLQELEAEHSRSATAVAERLAAADRRAGEAAASAATEGARHVEAERRVVALGSRVEALEGVQQQLEAQLNVERDAAANELSLRQASERELAEARDSLRVAKRAAEVAEAERSTAAAEVARLTADLKGAEERLQVANEHSLQGHLEAASSDEALSQLKQLREQDGERLMKLNSAKAELAQALKAAEERVASEVEAAGRAAKEAAARQYELQARLTEASRRVESLQVEHARSELRLEHERAAGSTTQEESSRRTRELAKERRERQQLAHELAAERALRSRCEEEAIALRREVEAARRETEVGAQRLTHLQAELQLATTEASEAAAVREYVDSAHRHREAVARERVSTAPPMPLPAPQLGRPAAGKVHFADEVRDEGMQWLNTTREDGLDDELGRSDLWNFSSGVMARGGATSNRGGLRQRVTTSPSLPQIVGPFRTACT